MSYSQRLLEEGSSLTRLAHRSRFTQVLKAVGTQPYRQAIDYGCGDGLLLKIAYEQNLISQGIGVDISPDMIAACQETCRQLPIQFFTPERLTEKIPPHSCDLAFCTETLEHVGDPDAILEGMLQLCQKGAKLIISVPIEIGPALIAKQIGRYLANFKSHYGYEKYTFQELFAASILWDVKSFPSSHSLAAPYRAHKGFDYRTLEAKISQKVTIEQRLFSPFPGLGNWVNSTVIWICRV